MITITSISSKNQSPDSILANLEAARDLLTAAGTALYAHTGPDHPATSPTLRAAARIVVEEAASAVREAATAFANISSPPGPSEQNNAAVDAWRLLALTYVLSRELEHDTPTDGRMACENVAGDMAHLAASVADALADRIMRVIHQRAVA